MPPKIEDPVATFWSRVEKTDTCWNWTGGVTIYGYGLMKINGVRQQAHRFAYGQAVGPIPEDLLIRHSCDNRLCVRPSHLQPGTHADNMRDMVERNRSAKGERHSQAKLTDAEVRTIRRDYRPGVYARAGTGASAAELAERFGVSKSNIQEIVSGRRWTHLEQDKPV